MSRPCCRTWYRRLFERKKPPSQRFPARVRTRLVLEELETRAVPASLLPNGNYVEVVFTNNTGSGGQPSSNLWVSVVSQTYLGSVSSITRRTSGSRSIGPQIWGCGAIFIPMAIVCLPISLRVLASLFS